VTGQPERSLLAQIKELIAAQLLREVESDHFAFRHALTQQAIYQGLLGRERRSLHQTLLTALESRTTAGESHLNDTSTDLSASLAYHAHAGQQWEKSLHYSRRAGEQAQWHLRGLALVQQKRVAEAEQVWLAGSAAAHKQALRPQLWRLQLALGDLYHNQRQQELAQTWLAAAQTTVNHLAADLPDLHLRQSLLQGFAARLPNAPKPTPLRSAKQAFDGLTAREREVSALVAQGLTNRVIAEQLVVSERTVEKHVKNAVGKLGFASRTQLAVWATGRGLKA
jgi:DNA-binding CsgD family transcriptional regulator